MSDIRRMADRAYKWHDRYTWYGIKGLAANEQIFLFFDDIVLEVAFPKDINLCKKLVYGVWENAL